MNDAQAGQIASLTGASVDEVRKVEVQRTLDGTYSVGFPDANPVRSVEKGRLADIVSGALVDLNSMTAAKSDEDLKIQMQTLLSELQGSIETGADPLSPANVKAIIDKLASVSTEKATKTSIIAPRYAQIIEALTEIHSEISQPSASENAEARNTALGFVPPFVYYSNYGNLDSEIYLPHVIENLKRTDLGPKEDAKARTLRVLFEFVRLKPEEILELGKDIDTSSAKPSEDEIKAIAEKRRKEPCYSSRHPRS